MRPVCSDEIARFTSISFYSYALISGLPLLKINKFFGTCAIYLFVDLSKNRSLVNVVFLTYSICNPKDNYNFFSVKTVKKVLHAMEKHFIEFVHFSLGFALIRTCYFFFNV